MSEVEKKYYTEEDMIKMDCRNEFIAFSNRDLFYDFFLVKD